MAVTKVTQEKRENETVVRISTSTGDILVTVKNDVRNTAIIEIQDRESEETVLSREVAHLSTSTIAECLREEHWGLWIPSPDFQHGPLKVITTKEIK